MKITDCTITFTLDHLADLTLEQGYNLRSMAEEGVYAAVGCLTAAWAENIVAERVQKDNPELMTELKEVMRALRKYRTDMKEMLLPVLRKLEKAGRKAERALDAEEEAAE